LRGEGIVYDREVGGEARVAEPLRIRRSGGGLERGGGWEQRE